MIQKVGEGAFGTVLKARHRVSGVVVALKKVRVRDVRELPLNALRELNALRCCDHPNVIKLLDTLTHGANLVFVLPFMPRSLAWLLSERDTPLPERHAATLGRMLLAGLSAIHAEHLLHRDIKPHNLLLSEGGMLCIADFGQARLLTSEAGGSLSHAVATRWYRAPELLLGSRHYGAAVDVWAAGCVLAQLHTLSALLAGESDIDQLFCVLQFLGSPTDASWPGYRELPDTSKITMPEDVPPVPLAELMPLATEAHVRLCATMLVYDSCRRPTCRDALHDPWFAQAAPEMSCVLAQDDNTLDDNVLQVGTSLGTPPVAPLAELLQDIERVAASASAAGSRDSSMRRSNRVKAAAAPVAFPWHMF